MDCMAGLRALGLGVWWVRTAVLCYAAGSEEDVSERVRIALIRFSASMGVFGSTLDLKGINLMPVFFLAFLLS